MSPPLWDPGWIHIRRHSVLLFFFIIHYLSTITRKLVRDGKEEATWFCTWRHWWKSWRLDSSSLVKRLQSQEFLYLMSPAPAINLTNPLATLLNSSHICCKPKSSVFLPLAYFSSSPLSVCNCCLFSLAIPAWTMQLIYQLILYSSAVFLFMSTKKLKHKVSFRMTLTLHSFQSVVDCILCCVLYARK